MGIRDKIDSNQGEYDCDNCSFASSELSGEWDVHADHSDGGKTYKCPECGEIGWKWSPGKTARKV